MKDSFKSRTRSNKLIRNMLRRAKSFMVKNQQTQESEADLELSETAHLRRKFIPITTTQQQQPIYECISQQYNNNNKPQPEVTKPNKEIRQSFRGLRRQISISVDNFMKNGLFVRDTKRQENIVETRKNAVCTRKSFRNTIVRKESEKRVFEVQHNNASRLRINQFKKMTDK